MPICHEDPLSAMAGAASLAGAHDERAMSTQTALGTDPKTGTGTDPRNGLFSRYTLGGTFKSCSSPTTHPKNCTVRRPRDPPETALRVGRGQFFDVPCYLSECWCLLYRRVPFLFSSFLFSFLVLWPHPVYVVARVIDLDGSGGLHLPGRSDVSPGRDETRR